MLASVSGKKMKLYDNPYQSEKWREENLYQRTQREREELDNAIQGYFIGVLMFFFILGVIYLLLK
jgi:hypothetical protein